MNDDGANLICPELLRLDPEGPSLLGSRCRACGETYFPASINCTRCQVADQEPLDLGRDGRLWSWTVQSFLPKPPYDSGETEADFRPYGIGYIETICGLKIESRLTEADPARLRIGMPMRLVIDSYGRANGRSTFAFAPT